MKRISKYQWLALIGFVTFICLWRLFGRDAEFKEIGYPLEVIDNEIRVKETGETLYRFIPVDGGNMTFSYSDTITIAGKSEVLITAYKKYINSLIIGETPVTKRLWYYVMKNIDIAANENSAYKYWTVYEDSVDEDGWKSFITKLGDLTGRQFRIPSSDEWEYAARGGMLSKNYKYSGSDSIDKVAYYKENALPYEMSLVGKQKQPNELGLYDMSGGVWELTTTQWFEINRTLLPHKSQLPADLPMSISRGGNYNSPADCCSVNSYGIKTNTGLRLILNY